MKSSFSLLLLLLSSTLCAADLQDGDVARLDYEGAQIYQVEKVEKKITSYVSGGTRYYQANFRFHVIGEGNTCGGLRSTLGTTHTYGEDRIHTRLLTGAKKVSEPTQCAQYSKETRLVIPEVLDLGTSEAISRIFDFGESNVVVKWQNRQLTTTINNVEN